MCKEVFSNKLSKFEKKYTPYKKKKKKRKTDSYFRNFKRKVFL